MKVGPQISSNRPRLRGGFSLGEVLIAMGIFGIGLAFTASLFPTGASQTKTSIDNVLGPMICENGLSIVKTRFTHSSNPYTTQTLTYVSGSIPSVDYRFPTSDDTTLLGYRVAGRQMRSGENDYQFVFVACRRSEITAGVSMKTASGKISDYQNTSRIVFTSGAGHLQAGTPVIVRSASATVLSTEEIVGGEWAIVVAIDGATVTLDHRLPATTGNADLYVIKDSGPNAYQSPAMSVLVTRTPLPE